jgi:hypothetical protein
MAIITTMCIPQTSILRNITDLWTYRLPLQFSFAHASLERHLQVQYSTHCTVCSYVRSRNNHILELPGFQRLWCKVSIGCFLYILMIYYNYIPSKPGYWRSINHTLLNHCDVRCEAHISWFVDTSSRSCLCRGLVVENQG